MNINDKNSADSQEHYQYSYQNTNSFDPNLGAHTYGEETDDLNNCSNVTSYGNVILVPNCSGIIGHENGLLSVAEAAQTIESGILDQYNILPSDHRIITSYVRSESDHSHLYATHQEILATTDHISNVPHTNTTHDYHQSPNTADCFVHHENLTNTVNGTTQIIFRRSPNSHLFQQIPNYVLQAEDDQHAQDIVSPHDVFQQYATENAPINDSVENGNNGMIVVPNDDRINLIFNNPLQYDENPHHNILTVEHPDTGFTGANHQPVPQQTELVNVVLPLDDKDQLLEMTISPLLAAINDITSREGRHWTNYKKDDNLQYYNINETGPEVASTSSTSMINNHRNSDYKMGNLSDEYVDINDVKRIDLVSERNHDDSYDDDDYIDDDSLLTEDDGKNCRRSKRKVQKEECLMVLDKHVPCRSWASLPSSYLSIGKLTKSTSVSEFTVFSKKQIPAATKFGPFEGDLRKINDVDLDKLKLETTTKYPLLLVGDSILDTSNENTSNWMQFVRYAATFREQNLELFETNRKLYFKSCRAIKIKEELRVGYHEDYARKYNLRMLLKTEDDDDDSDYDLWPCFECDKKFATSAEMQAHLNVHDEPEVDQTTTARRKSKTPIRPKKIAKRRNNCPVCSKSFFKMNNFKRHLKNHAGHPLAQHLFDSEGNLVHAQKKKSRKSFKNKAANKENEFKCDSCFKSFLTADRLKKHRLVHSPNELKPFQCTHCSKRFLKLSAMTAHVKMHLFQRNYYECLLCKKRFKHTREFTTHVQTHMENGCYTCPTCDKTFKAYVLIRKHMRTFHLSPMHTCTVCSKQFVLSDKLKLHMLCHSDKRDYLCSTCGKQFKRQDKLKEHIRNVHVRQAVNAREGGSKKTPDTKSKVSPNDYERFIYKCHDCLLGFKRRGMLVNHLAKRHPEIQIESVPELNLPILKAQKFFYCQYCNKVYRSNTKRKLHILKYHPGSELPMSTRHKGGVPEIPGLPNPTYTETVSTITTHPHSCEWCHKQYASRTKLVQHQRSKHADMLGRETRSCDESGQRYHHNYLPIEASTSKEISSSSSTTKGLKPNKADISNSSSSSMNSTELPQLFEEIDYVTTVRSVSHSASSKKHNQSYYFPQNGG